MQIYTAQLLTIISPYKNVDASKTVIIDQEQRTPRNGELRWLQTNMEVELQRVLGSFVSTRSGAKDCSIVETFPKKTVLGEI